MASCFRVFICSLILILFSGELFASEVGYMHREAQKDKERDKDRARRAARAAYMKNPLGNCLKNPAIANGAAVRVNYDKGKLCEDFMIGDLYSFSKVAYTIKKKNNRILVDLPMNLTYVGGQKNQVKVMNSVMAAKFCVEKFFISYGLYLNIKAAFVGPQRNSSALQINVDDECSRSQSDHWCILKDVGRERDLNSLCSMMAHEVGHVLGLPDRYPERSKCPDRKTVGPMDNLMHMGGEWPIHRLKLSTDDVAIIAGPLCEK